MRSTLSRSVAALAAGAALSLASAGVAFADATPVPDDVIPHDNTHNQASFWEAYLLEEFGIEATCTKDDKPGDPWIVPAAPSGQAWVLAVVKGGAGDSANELYYEPEAGWALSHQSKGNSHVIICSAVPEEVPTTPPTTETTPPTTPPTTETTPPTTETTPPTTATTPPTTPTTPVTTSTPPATGPVIETDRPGGSGGAASLGLVAAAGVLAAAAGALVLNRRRQSAEH